MRSAHLGTESDKQESAEAAECPERDLRILAGSHDCDRREANEPNAYYSGRPGRLEAELDVFKEVHELSLSGMRECHQVGQLPIRRLFSQLVNERTPVHVAVLFAVVIVVAELINNVCRRNSVGGLEKGLSLDFVHARVIGSNRKNFRQ